MGPQSLRLGLPGDPSDAVMGGLLVATILTLIFLPTLYVTWFSLTEKQSGTQAATPA